MSLFYLNYVMIRCSYVRKQTLMTTNFASLQLYRFLFIWYEMGRLLYIIAILFLVVWVIGFFFYSIGAIVHVLLLLALLTFLLIINRGSRNPRMHYRWILYMHQILYRKKDAKGWADTRKALSKYISLMIFSYYFADSKPNSGSWVIFVVMQPIK